MMYKISIIILLCVLSNYSAESQDGKLFEWVFPLGEGRVYRTLQQESEGSNLFIARNGQILQLDSNGAVVARYPAKVQNIIDSSIKGNRWGSSSTSNGTNIIDLNTFRTILTPYDRVEHIGGPFFRGFYDGDDFIYLINMNNDAFEFKLDNAERDYSIEANTDHFIVNNYKTKVVGVYDQNGDLLFEKTDCYINTISEKNQVFLINGRSDGKEYLVNGKGEIIFDDFKACNTFRTKDFTTGIKLVTHQSKPIHLNYDGIPLEGLVEIPTDHPNVITIENCEDSKIGLRFIAQNKRVACQYDKVTVSTTSISYGKRDVVIAEKGKEEKDYYTLDGTLIYQSKGHQYERYLRNDNFLIAKGGKCGIIDNQDSIMVPFNYGLRGGFMGDPCWGSTFEYKGRDFFVITNKQSHAFVFDEQKEILSFTDAYYGSKIGGIGDHLILSKGKRDSQVGLISLETKEVVLPFEYFHIYSNPFRDNDEREFAILSKFQGAKSLYHIPSKQILLTDFDGIRFISDRLIECRRGRQIGVVRLLR